MKRLLGIVMFALALSFVTSGAARAEVSTNTSVPFSLDVFVPCGPNGGQPVHVEGGLHIVLSLTVNGTHGSAKVHYQPQGVSGTAADGTKYEAVGVTQEMFDLDFANGQATHTYVNNFRLIGQGPGNNLVVHENLHMTINANGVVTATVDNFSASCK